MSRDDDVRATFTFASQPDIVRAAQKDDYYVQVVNDACLDVSRRLFGHRPTMGKQREISLLAGLLYHGLTTGSGSQTLGEEYVDILEVCGAAQRPVGGGRRALLVGLQTLLPYALAKSRERALRRPEPARPAGRTVGEALPGTSGRQEGEASSLSAAAKERARGLAAQLRRALPYLQAAAGPLLRLNMALFYLHGVFYHPAFRVLGVRYIFIGKMLEERPRYSTLGSLLLLQLAVGAAVWARDTGAVGAARARLLGETPQGSEDDPSASAVSTKVLVLDPYGRPVEELPDEAPEPSADTVTQSAAPAGAKCALCLSQRQRPAAAPCGHVFCWNCAAEWCLQKPECPLCRAPARPSDLVALYHSDF